MTITSTQKPPVDASIHFTLRGLDTGVNLFERIELEDISGEIAYHHFIAREQVVAASFDFVFWFRCPSGSFVIEDLLDENRFDTAFAIQSENWRMSLPYSEFLPDSGIDLCYNHIGENIELYSDKDTLANIGVNRIARQVSSNYMNTNIFKNKADLLQNYIELDASINESIVLKLERGGTFDKPLFNSINKENNITRCLLETLLESESSKNRVQSMINTATSKDGNGDVIGNSWVSLKFQKGDKIRHKLTYNVANIVIDYSNNNIIDSINGKRSDEYPNIIAGGSFIDMSSVILTDQHFLIEYELV
tara:strand:- start:2274 stop:3191 length:918 start_codon:yes stop_codon:yes gene_type:complete